jgi:hypothetical protein
MFMSRWKPERERRQQKIEVLQLLIVSGAVRPADVYIRYRGPDILLGTGSSDSDLLCSEAVANHRYIWTIYFREWWKTYRRGSAQLAVQMKRHLAPNRHALPEPKAGTSGNWLCPLKRVQILC